jgi:hypothetical protein
VQFGVGLELRDLRLEVQHRRLQALPRALQNVPAGLRTTQTLEVQEQSMKHCNNKKEETETEVIVISFKYFPSKNGEKNGQF